MPRGRGKRGRGVSVQLPTSGSGRGRGKIIAVEKNVGRSSRTRSSVVSPDQDQSNEDKVISGSVSTSGCSTPVPIVSTPIDIPNVDRLSTSSVSIHTALSDQNSDEYVPTTTLLYSTLGQDHSIPHPRGVSESSSNSTVGTPVGSATPMSESAESSCDDSEQFSLASVLDKTRRVSSLSSTSSMVFSNSRDEDDAISPGETVETGYHRAGQLHNDVFASDQRNAFNNDSSVFNNDFVENSTIYSDQPKMLGTPKCVQNKPKEELKYVASAIKEAVSKVFPVKSSKVKVKEAIREVLFPPVSNRLNDSVPPTISRVKQSSDEPGISPIIAALELGINPFKSDLTSKEPVNIFQPSHVSDSSLTANHSVKSESEQAGDNFIVDTTTCLGQQQLIKPSIGDDKTENTPTNSKHGNDPEGTCQKPSEPAVTPVKTPYKSWTDAIWGPKEPSPIKSTNPSAQESSSNSKARNYGDPKNLKPSQAVSIKENLVSDMETLESNASEVTLEESIEPKNKMKTASSMVSGVRSKSSKKNLQVPNSVSSSSTPSTGSPTDSNLSTNNGESSKKGKSKKSKVSKKPSKPRRRIQCASDLDSEDSSVSTDSPLKPKTYTKPLDVVSIPPVEVVTPRSTRIPKKKKDPEVLQKTEEVTSPVEELPLIPKGFLEQKKKLEDFEAKKRELEAKDRIEAENVELTKRETEQRVNEKKVTDAEDRKEVESKLKSFKHLKENHYLCPRKVNKQSKKMQCDCTLSKEEVHQGETGCGDDCLNRLLYIECGKVCQLESNCSNKRFQNNENANIEVFKTDWKGFGIRARGFIPKDTFLMEYVGEVLDNKQFKKRAKQYAKDDVQHFYFMALSKDFYVDATSKGNISRFINHSCDPNAETQKWTVNGELRVGFFTKRAVTEGEELSFDYRFERYGNVAQKCYCGTSRCRGWLGGEPGSDSGIEEMDEWSSSEEEQEDLSKDALAAAEMERKKKKKKRPAKKIKNFEVDEYEEEVERISSTGIRNKLQTVQLCRLMVRAIRLSTRLKLAELLLEADQSCLRLFLDYQGVRILSHWMFDLEWSQEEMELKLRTENILAILNIPHKTMLVDSKVLQTVQRWSTDSPTSERKTESVEGDSQPQSTAATPNQSRASSPNSAVTLHTVQGVCSIGEDKLSPLISQEMESTEAVDMDIDTEETQRCEEQEPSPPGEDYFQPGEEILPPGAERAFQSEMPGCVEQGVSEARGGEGEAMVTGEQVCSIMKAQAGVAEDQQASAEVESEQVEDDKVQPVPREQLPLTEEEEKQREQMGGQVTKVEISEDEKLVKEIQERAKELLDIWSTLQEVFKIPKKERQAVRREHEREADRSWGGWGGEAYTDTPESRLAMLQANAKLYATMQTNTGGQERGQHRGRAHQGYSRGYQVPTLGYPENQGVMRGGYTGGRLSSGGPPARERRNLRLDDRTGRLSRANLYRDDRRMLFQAKVEEENRQKVLREALSARHNQCCRLLGMDPVTTPMLNKYPEFYLSVGKWIPMPEPPLPIDPTWTTPVMAALPPQAFKPGDPPLTNPRSIYPPGICPERPPPPQPVSDHPSESYEQVCAYFDQLYYGVSQSPRATHPASTSPSPSPIPQKSRRSHSPSSISHCLPSDMDRNHSGPNSPSMLSPSSFPINIDLSPDYRSPSPVHRSRSKSPSEPNPSSNHPSHTAPTSIPFLSSSPAIDELLPTRQRSQLSPLSTDATFSPTSHSDTQTVVQTQTNREADSALIVKLPPKWKSARDSSGRVYYYHSVSRVTQWDPPSQEQEEEEEEGGVDYVNNEYSMETADTDDEEDRSEDGDDTDTEDDSEEESEDTAVENGGENKEEAEDGEIPDSDLSASEKRMLLRMRGRTKEERTNIRRMKKERDKERREQERLVSRERHTRHRRDGLVEEHLVPARISEKDKADLMTFKEMRERLLNKDKIREQQLKEEKGEDEKERREEKAKQDKIRKEERRAAEKAKREVEFRNVTGDGETIGVSGLVTPEPSHATPIKVTPQPSSSSDSPSQSTPASSKKTTQAAADTSSDVEKKHKEKFVKEMSKVVVKILDPYRKKGVRGHIGNTDDFKHLAKKLTYSITHKELKHCKAAEELKATEKVKKKASEYVSKYMKKYDREYKKSPDQDS